MDKALREGGTSRFSESVKFTVTAAAVGATVGLAQWVVLRHSAFRAGWWVLANAVGFCAAIPIALGVFFAKSGPGLFDIPGTEWLVVAFVSAGVVVGSITGLGLAWLSKGERRGNVTASPS